MEGYYKGKVSQMTPDAAVPTWQRPKTWTGDELRFASISALDATLDTSRFHISMPISGHEPYFVDGVHHSANAGEYFIFNPKQHVTAAGVFKENVEGFCFFLSEKTIQETAGAIGQPIEKSLDSPFDYPWQQQEFMVKNYRLQENSFGQYLLRLRQKLPAKPGSLLVDWDAFYFEMATEFLCAHRQIGQHLRAIPSARTLTKQEIYRRLSLAHSYILEKYTRPVSLEDLEKTAFFSKYHIVRLYRQVYGLTPHQHVLQLRVEKAKELLLRNHSPTGVAHELSFSDRRAFSKVFKRLTGVAPSVFQKENKGL